MAAKTDRSAGCDPVDYPDRRRRDYNEVMAEIARDRRRELVAGEVHETAPSAHKTA